MSREHDALFHILNESKVKFEPNTHPDYVSRREEEKKNGNILPEGVLVEQLELNSVPVERVFQPDNSEEKILLYVHGGGFVSGSSVSRRIFTGYLVKEWNYNLYSVDYRLAPEFPFPAALDDCFEVYRKLLMEFGEKKIILIGESAGGNLVLSLAVKIKQEKLPMPAKIIAISPAVQYTSELSSYEKNRNTDCMLTNIQEEIKATYLCTNDTKLLKNPLISPYYADVTGFPPIMLSASNAEILRDDTLLFFDKLCQAEIKAELSMRDGMMHAYPIMTPLPEAMDEIKKMKQFIES